MVGILVHSCFDFYVQGSPEFLASYACETYFEWQTVAACKSASPISETPETVCYVYGDNGQKRDLTMLIKGTGAYDVMTYDESQMYINVCRDISECKLLLSRLTLLPLPKFIFSVICACCLIMKK